MNKLIVKEVVEKYTYRELYYIVKYTNNKFGAINNNYLDEHGKTKVQLNGGQVFLSDTIEGLKQKITIHYQFEEWLNEGKTQEEIAKLYFDKFVNIAQKNI